MPCPQLHKNAGTQSSELLRRVPSHAPTCIRTAITAAAAAAAANAANANAAAANAANANANANTGGRRRETAWRGVVRA